MEKVQFLLVFCLCYISLGAQSTSTYDAHVPNRYFETVLKIIPTTPGFSPPVVSRAMGYIGLTTFEATVPGIPNYQSSDGILPGLGPNAISAPTSSIHYPTAVNNALAAVIDSLFANTTATNRTILYALRDSFNTVFAAQPNYAYSKTWGETIGMEVFMYSMTDGGHRGYTRNVPAGYVTPVGYGLWEPTAPAFQAIPVQPYWGNNRTFDPENNGNLIPGPHLFFDTLVGSQFYQAVKEVYDITTNLSTEQSNIAKFWADGGGTITPPGHSMFLVNKLIKEEGENLEFAAIAYAKAGMAVSDAFVNCWKTKYAYNLMRPITYIRKYIDPAWSPLIGTPPFPEYTSGHSTQSGAICAVMESLYGSSKAFVDNLYGTSYGGPRSYPNFEAAAYEAAISRLYGGIHYQFSNTLGVEVGKSVGSNINAIFATQLRTNAVVDAAIEIKSSISFAHVGDTVELTINLVNQGLTALSGVQIKSLVPVGMTYVNHNNWEGMYDATTGVWTIDSVQAGVPELTLKIKAVVLQEGVAYQTAELIALTQTDNDSAPNNGLLTEDDIAATCLSVPMVLCQPNLTLSAPAGYTGYQWLRSTDQGVTYTQVGTAQTLTVSQGGFYKFVVDGGIIGTCGNQLCCPLIVEEQCCPVKICLPIVATRN
jgi:uncharacterized repeat protein (TIGR01451 family)